MESRHKYFHLIHADVWLKTNPNRPSDSVAFRARFRKMLFQPRRHQVHVRLGEHRGMVSWNPMKIDAALNQIFPAECKIEISALRPVGGLEQHHLARVSLRLIPVKSAVDKGI